MIVAISFVIVFYWDSITEYIELNYGNKKGSLLKSILTYLIWPFT